MQTEVLASSARENGVLAYLEPALEQAIVTRRPASAHWVPTSLRSEELVALAVGLCRRSGANVAVLANREARGVTFAPFR